MVEFDGTSVVPSRSVPTCRAAGEGARLLGVNSADSSDRRQLPVDSRSDVTRALSSRESHGEEAAPLRPATPAEP
eukprot:737170-Rhodomonas_salina.1